MMAREAIVVLAAEDRHNKRKLVDRRQIERMEMLHDEKFFQRVVVESIFSLPRLSESSGETRREEDRRSLSVPVGDERSVPLKIKERVLNEIKAECAKKKRQPRRSPVLRRHYRHQNTSLTYPTPSAIEQCSNPGLRSLAERLLVLERERPSSPPRLCDRTLAQLRLTEKSVAQEARRFIHVNEKETKTIHDGVPPQIGVSSRLYGKKHSGQTPSPKKHTPAPMDPIELEKFVTHFYHDQCAHHESVLIKAHNDLLKSGSLPTVLDPKMIARSVDRLHGTPIHNSNHHPSRQCPSVAPMSNEDAVNRFYTAPLVKQRDVMAELDRVYLGR